LYGNNTLPYKITLNATKDGEAKETRAARTVITNSYQFTYNVDGSGKITLVEE
jgi:hypothetical protein